jgi:RES domain-containing protein
LGGTELLAWRLDQRIFAKTWDSGEGPRRYGGRWNSVGRKAVYCSVDPATAILEVAVHKTFKALDTVPHVLTAARIEEPSLVHVVHSDVVPNSNWLRPGHPSAGQQTFGDRLLSTHPFVLVPSAVSTHSWNLLFDPDAARDLYAVRLQEDFALDTRLHPPASQ